MDLRISVWKPLKALADYVSCHKLDWTSKDPLIKSLRIEENQLSELPRADFDELGKNYSSRRVQRFLAGFTGWDRMNGMTGESETGLQEDGTG